MKKKAYKHYLGDKLNPEEIVILTIDTSKVNTSNKSILNFGYSIYKLDYDYINIDYGDGNIFSSSDKDANGSFAHEYKINSGLKQVIITGENIRNINFFDSYNLIEVNRFILPNLTSCYIIFMNCTNLVSIPEDMFKHNTEITSFDSIFYNCSSLTTIPDNLFQYNVKATNFSVCFCTCTSLTTIPSNLFQYNTLVIIFHSCFNSCTSLTTVPSNLFNNNTLVTAFSSCFQNCSNITSYVPVLWNRTNVTDYSYCYYNCTKAANYSNIPANWR